MKKAKLNIGKGFVTVSRFAEGLRFSLAHKTLEIAKQYGGFNTIGYINLSKLGKAFIEKEKEEGK